MRLTIITVSHLHFQSCQLVNTMELSYTSTTSLQLISLIRRGFPLKSTCTQLLRDASDGRVDIHYGDALEVDIPRACQEYVEKKHWEDGRCVKSDVLQMSCDMLINCLHSTKCTIMTQGPLVVNSLPFWSSGTMIEQFL